MIFLGKRHYTNKDAMKERFGRIYQLPFSWHQCGTPTELMLLDYRGIARAVACDTGMQVSSLPIFDPRSFQFLSIKVERARPRVIVASGDCFVGLLGLRLARTIGAKFVFDVYDDYRHFGAYRVFLGWNAFEHLIHHSDVVWYASRALASTHIGNAKRAVVPNGVNPDEFREIDQSVARVQLSLSNNRRWIGYFGSLDPARGIEDLISAVAILRDEDPSISLLLCGGGATLATHEPWIEYRGNVSHDAIPTYINACDVVAMPYRRGPLIDMVSPCKMAEYLFCGRPVVATKVPSLYSNFPSQAEELSAASALCEPGEPRDLARAIRSQLEHPTVVAAPHEQTWESIAAASLSTLDH